MRLADRRNISIRYGLFMLAASLVLIASDLQGFSQTAGAGITTSLDSIALLPAGTQSRMVSPENPTGGKGAGAMATPDPSNPDLAFSGAAIHLGQGWKVRPFIKVPAHSTATMMDVDGPGTIEHIWIAAGRDFKGYGRATVLRFYWDGEDTPSVEAPLSDFFAIGNDRFAPINSAVVVDVPTASLNCYSPMPFRKHARVTVTNDSEKPLGLFTWQIDYRLSAVPAEAGPHAQWRRATVPCPPRLYDPGRDQG